MLTDCWPLHVVDAHCRTNLAHIFHTQIFQEEIYKVRFSISGKLVVWFELLYALLRALQNFRSVRTQKSTRVSKIKLYLLDTFVSFKVKWAYSYSTLHHTKVWHRNCIITQEKGFSVGNFLQSNYVRVKYGGIERMENASKHLTRIITRRWKDEIHFTVNTLFINMLLYADS